jgi:ADP-ribosylglycohydrolase
VRAEALLTHRHPLAGDVSAAVAVLCRTLVRGSNCEPAQVAAVAACRPESRQTLEAAGRSPGGRGGFASEVLQATVHFVHHAPTFSEALAAAQVRAKAF